MTLPLQSMDKAPRDGSEVWCVYGSENIISCRWTEEYKCWCGNDQEYDDGHFSGWLDIPGMARDAERLALVLLMFQSPEWVQQVSRRVEYPHGLDAWRAAIDKEAERG